MSPERGGRPKKARFSLMSEEELVEHCRHLYQHHGFDALTFKALKAHDNLYFHLFERGIDIRKLIDRLGLSEAYKAYRADAPSHPQGTQHRALDLGAHRPRNGDDQIWDGIPAARGLVRGERQGTLVTSVYYLDRSWEELREALGDFNASQFVELRSGIRWRSHPEASLSNFLHARGIRHKKGERYPEAYEEATGRAYGFYDLHFEGRSGRVDVEIWGDKPRGHDAATYEAKRRQKEAFNAANPQFLGIEFNDCFSDETLSGILEAHIGTVQPFVFDRATDRQIESSHWSNADELLEFCRHLAAQMPDGHFPAEDWLRKRGRWADRDGPTYNTASIYIKKWLGGVRNLRCLLGQAHASTQQWDRASTLARWEAFHREHGATPSQVRHAARNGVSYPTSVINQASGLIPAAINHDAVAHLRWVMEVRRAGVAMRPFQAVQQASTMAS